MNTQPRSWAGILAALLLTPAHAFAVTAETGPDLNPTPVALPALQDPGQKQRIDQAIPLRAIVTPKKPRKLLIFELNVGYGGHGSIAHASYAFSVMGAKTGAYETVISRDPSVFQPESLRQFDAVFFNNNVGNLFEDVKLRQSLVDFIYGGGGMLGVHGTTVAFTRWPGALEDWPEFGLMIGGRGANHKESDEHVFIKLDDPGHPLNQIFGRQGFDYRDEFFRVHDPYSRHRVRVLLSIDNDKTDPHRGQPRGNTFRADNDYALSWVRNYGRGRIFYCTIAHNPYVFWDPKLLRFFLDAIQFALGDLPAPTTPSAKLTPTVRAQEKLGWRLGIEFPGHPIPTLFESIDHAAALGFLHVSGSSTQPVSRDIPKIFDPQLSDEERKQIRLKLDSTGVRLLTYSDAQGLPEDEASGRQMFAFLRALGVETLILSPPRESLDMLEKLCLEYDLNVALGSRRPSATDPSKVLYRNPKEILQACQNRSPKIGAFVDVEAWLRDGIDPLDSIRLLKHRVINVRLADTSTRDASPVAPGQAKADIKQLLKELRSSGVQPTMFSLGTSATAVPLPDLTRSLEDFNLTTLELAQ